MPPSRRRAIAGSAGLLTLPWLGACGSGAADDGPVTELRIPTTEVPWLASYRQVAADYEAVSGVRVEFTVFPFDGLLTQQANAAQIGSGAFDLFQLNEQWVGLFYDNQWVQPLTDVDPDFSWDPGLIEFDGVGRWDRDRRTTSTDGVPHSLPINGNIHLFMYRTDLYEQLGLAVPTTWDEVISNGERSVDAGAVEDGYVVRGRTPTFDFSATLFSYGGSWFGGAADGDWEPTIDSPEARAALDVFGRLAAIGPAAPQTIAQAEATSLVQSGRVLHAALVAAVAAPLEDATSSDVAGRIGYAVLPGQTPVSGTWTLGVPAGLPPRRARAAYDFLTWLTGRDGMQRWTEYGGVTTRTDVTTDRPEILALQESADLVREGLRYPFAASMLDVTEAVLGQFVAGTVDADAALAQMQEELRDIVEEAGFLQ